jgi:hypothetical protein
MQLLVCRDPLFELVLALLCWADAALSDRGWNSNREVFTPLWVTLRVLRGLDPGYVNWIARVGVDLLPCIAAGVSPRLTTRPVDRPGRGRPCEERSSIVPSLSVGGARWTAVPTPCPLKGYYTGSCGQ